MGVPADWANDMHLQRHVGAVPEHNQDARDRVLRRDRQRLRRGSGDVNGGNSIQSTACQCYNTNLLSAIQETCNGIDEDCKRAHR